MRLLKVVWHICKPLWRVLQEIGNCNVKLQFMMADYETNCSTATFDWQIFPKASVQMLLAKKLWVPFLFLISKLKGFEFLNFHSILLMSDATCRRNFIEIWGPFHRTRHQWQLVIQWLIPWQQCFMPNQNPECHFTCQWMTRLLLMTSSMKWAPGVLANASDYLQYFVLWNSRDVLKWGELWWCSAFRNPYKSLCK